LFLSADAVRDPAAQAPAFISERMVMLQFSIRKEITK
jgi:hypothetical protein